MEIIMAIVNQRIKKTTYKIRKSQGNNKHCPVCGKFMSKNKSTKKK